jgi:hypothetical protein
MMLADVICRMGTKAKSSRTVNATSSGLPDVLLVVDGNKVPVKALKGGSQR